MTAAAPRRPDLALPHSAESLDLARWGSVVTHTHLLRTGKVPAAEVPGRIATWAAAHQLRAMGVGSPWEPLSSAAYGRCEGRDRDLYYAGRIPRHEVMCEEAVHGLVADLNQRAPCTCFYLDNETPKCRYGHIWWFGFNYLWPAWHDYSQEGPVWFNEQDTDANRNAIDGSWHRRRAYLEVVAEQRRLGGLAVWAHPTSWWRDGGRFVTNIAAEIALHLHADGFLDGLAVMGYDACHRSYQDLWFHLLDSGATVPGFAETDMCYDDGRRRDDEQVLATRMLLPERTSAAMVVDAARRGEAYCTSGPHLTITVDGAAMGSRIASGTGYLHRVRVTAWPAPGQQALARIELVGRGGQVIGRCDGFTGGELEWEISGSDQPGWLLARAWGQDDDPDAARQQDIRHHAITNPVYLAHGPAFSAVASRLRLGVRPDSPWLGGTWRSTDVDGRILESGTVSAGLLELALPGSGRIELQRGERNHAFFASSEDRRVQALLKRLWAGGFLDGVADLQPGEVPAGEFALTAMRDALTCMAHEV